MIKATLIIDALGFPENKVKDSLKNLVEKLKNYCKVEDEKYSEVVKESDRVFSCFVEVKCSFDNFVKLIEAMINFGPRIVEIEEPKEIKLKVNEIEEVANLFASKMHEINETMLMLQTSIKVLMNKINNLKKNTTRK